MGEHRANYEKNFNGAQELTVVVVGLDLEFSPAASCFPARFRAVEHKDTRTYTSTLVSHTQFVAYHIQGTAEQGISDLPAVAQRNGFFQNFRMSKTERNGKCNFRDLKVDKWRVTTSLFTVGRTVASFR